MGGKAQTEVIELDNNLWEVIMDTEQEILSQEQPWWLEELYKAHLINWPG